MSDTAVDQVSTDTTDAGQVPVDKGKGTPDATGSQAVDLSTLPEGVRAYIAGLRSEAASARVKLNKFEAETEAAKKEKMSAQERLQADLDAARKAATAMTARLVSQEIEQEARDFHDPVGARARIEGAIVYGDDGAPTNIKELVTKLRAEQPGLVKPTTPAVGATSPAKSTQGGPTPEQLAVQQTLQLAGYGTQPASGEGHPVFSHAVQQKLGGGVFIVEKQPKEE
jgi:hypothetical protein